MLAARGVDVCRLVLTDGQRTFNDPADVYTADHGTALRTVLAAIDVAPPLAAHLIAQDQHSDHIMAIVALARQIGPVIAAAPPEDWTDLIEGATAMMADACHGGDDLDRYREPILIATVEAVDSWEPLRRALLEAPVSPPAAEPEISQAAQARERLNQIMGHSGHHAAAWPVGVHDRLGGDRRAAPS